MSQPINPEHLLEDELAEELAVRSIVDRGETGLAKLMLNLASEYSGVLQKPVALPNIRQASEMRACLNKMKELSDSIQDGIRESDESKLSVLQSRYFHLQDRVNRLLPVARSYDGIDKLDSDVSYLGVLLSDALASIGSPPIMSSHSFQEEGATSFDQQNEADITISSTAATPIMTTSIQPSNAPPPSYNSVFSEPVSTFQSESQQTNVDDDFNANAPRRTVNFDFVTPPNSDTGIIAAMQKQRQSMSVPVSGPQVGKTTGATSKTGASQFHKVSCDNANSRSQKQVPCVVSNISMNSSSYAFPPPVSNITSVPVQTRHNVHSNSASNAQMPSTMVPPQSARVNATSAQAQSFSSAQYPPQFSRSNPTAVPTQKFYYSAVPPQDQGLNDGFYPQQQFRFGQSNQTAFPSQQFFYGGVPQQPQVFRTTGHTQQQPLYGQVFSTDIPQQPTYADFCPPEPQRYGQDFLPYQQPAPIIQQNQAIPAQANPLQVRPGLMYQMGKWNLQFRGTASDFPVDEFLFRVETLARSSNIAEDMLPFGMHYVLHGEAQSWYWVYHRDNPQADWITFKDAMRRHFSLVETQVEIREKISKRKQRLGEVFNEFYLAVAGIAARLSQRMPENELVEILRANMIPQLKNALLFQPTLTVAQLQECCKRCERLWQAESMVASQQPKPAFTPRVQEICAPVEPITYSDNRFDTSNYYNPIQPQFVYGDQVEAIQKTDDRKKLVNRTDLMVCWNCDEMGHSFDICTVATRNVFCYGCGAKNVYKPNCTRCSSGNSKQGGPNPFSVRPSQVLRKANP